MFCLFQVINILTIGAWLKMSVWIYTCNLSRKGHLQHLVANRAVLRYPV